MMTEQLVLTRREGRVGIIELNRPEQLNALNDTLMDKLGTALLAFDADPAIGCLILTGGSKVFAAGADVLPMSSLGYPQVVKENFISRNWDTLSRVRKPVIAAVAGYALGAGCELAMMCDFILAADDARFGQPEIKLGIIPGAGGTQRLPRAIGKAKAMEMVLSGRLMDAGEAERAGLVARVVPVDALAATALESAAMIAALSLPSVLAAKEALNRCFESSLSEGLLFERRSFHALFATADQKEGMAAFREKRKPAFRHE
jgi:enoyl-CoA hydratase